MEITKIKKIARNKGINIISITENDFNIVVKYYAFNSERNYRTNEKESIFTSLKEVVGWIEEL